VRARHRVTHDIEHPRPAPQVAVERAVVYDKCAGLSGADKEACQLDKALVNVAAIFAQQVEGRVSTEVDPRAAFDTGATAALAGSTQAV
jgi:transaldolase